MGKIAFVFAGQGAQYPGMGLELCNNSESAAKVLKTADELRQGTSYQCFSGSEEELRETKNTQPCMFAVEMATAAALSEKGICADMAAGFSVGELAALTYSKVMDFETGFTLVCKRGELMQEDAEREPTAMAAVIRLSNEEIEGICAKFSAVYPVNYNYNGQVSVAGLKSEMEDFSNAVKAAGGRALPLKVKGGFHSPFMEQASKAFAKELEGVNLLLPSIDIYSNLTGKPYSGNMKELISKQICSPVRWETIIKNMIAAGADTFIELGPGNTLCGMISKIDKAVRTFSVSDKKDLDNVLAEGETC